MKYCSTGMWGGLGVMYTWHINLPSYSVDRPKLSINSSAANSSQSTVNDWRYLTFDWQMFVFNEHLDPVKYFLYSPLYLPLTCELFVFKYIYRKCTVYICIEHIYIYIYIYIYVCFQYIYSTCDDRLLTN